MAMKHVKELVDQFETRVRQDGNMTFAEVLRKGKVVATLGQGPDLHKLYGWAGKAHNRQGKLKERDRSTSWNTLCEYDLQVELDKVLHRAVAQALLEAVEGRF